MFWTPRARELWLTNRGVALKDGRVYRGTSDGYLAALDASPGRLLWARRIADVSVGETLTMAPLVFDDRVLIGPAGSENAIRAGLARFAPKTACRCGASTSCPARASGLRDMEDGREDSAG